MPQPPPRDKNGNVIPHDHAEILADHIVIRRISDKQIVTDKDGLRKISSIAFKPAGGGANNGISVDIEQFIIAEGIDPRKFVTTPRWIGSVAFRTGVLRAQALMVGYDPIPKQNEFHGEVWGATTRAQWSWLQGIAEWYVPIPDVQLAA